MDCVRHLPILTKRALLVANTTGLVQSAPMRCSKVSPRVVQLTQAGGKTMASGSIKPHPAKVRANKILCVARLL